VAPMTRAATAKLVTDKRAISIDFLSGKLNGRRKTGGIHLQHRQ
jgi:hypothetical protein